VGRVLRAFEERGKTLPAAEIIVDSRPVPKGYGSSAAASVALTGALLALVEESVSGEEVFAIALAAHRAFQGGRGSGYDVAASTHGGVGLFCGGLSPTWQRIDPEWLPEMHIVRGAGQVKTPGAIGRYEAWKSRRTEEARQFVRDSNAAVAALAGARSWEKGLEILEAARVLGIALGERIGVAADLRLFEEGVFAKAVGAGAELALVIGSAVGESVAVSPKGLVIEGG
jgi:phosphomevalonate kinase